MASTTRAVRAESGSPPAIAVAAKTLVHTVGRLETRPSLSRMPGEVGRSVVLALIGEFLENEGELAGDVVGLRAHLQVIGKHVPGVGLHLEMRRERFHLQRMQGGQKGVLGRAEVP